MKFYIEDENKNMRVIITDAETGADVTEKYFNFDNGEFTINALNTIVEEDRKKDFRNMNLEGQNFENEDLSGACFYKASLRNVFLYDSSLVNANMTYADLKDADIGNTEITDANFEEAYLYGTSLEK